jgi:hypothetical protein
MAKQKMVAHEGTEMVPNDEMEPVKKHSGKHGGKKAKVNMILPSGSQLVVGEMAELTADDEAFLEKIHGEQMQHILEI